MAEVVIRHGGHVGLGISRPSAHLVWVLLREVLHCDGSAAVRVALTQHRVHSGTGNHSVGLLRVLVIRDVVTCSLQLSDCLL